MKRSKLWKAPNPPDASAEHAFGRRDWLHRLIAFSAAVMACGVPRGGAGANVVAEQPIAQRSAFMRAAEALRDQAVRAGDQPYGAVIVRGAEIVGRGPSRVVTGRDPTAHAEMEAIRDACRTLGTRDLSGCTMYGSASPCAMCETAAYWARLDEVRFGADGASGYPPRYAGC